MRRVVALAFAAALVGCASAPAPDAAGSARGALAVRLLDAALQEGEEAVRLYREIPELASAAGPEAQSRARRKVLEGALAAERAETLLRIRFAALGAPGVEPEPRLRLHFSLLATGADDLLEADRIDGAALAQWLPELTGPIDAMIAEIRQRGGAP